jgi:hypothetical protein
MSKSSPMLCRKTPASSTDAAREALRNFALFIGLSTGKKLVPERELFDIWVSALADLSAEQIQAASAALMKTWRYPNLPMPGDVRAQLDSADEKAFELEAKAEWRKLLAWIGENYFSDIGIRRGAPRLAPAVEHAARAAGGFHFIERCSEEELVWCQKTFVAALKNVRETQRAQSLIGSGEAKKILARLAAGPPDRRQLAQPRSQEKPEAGIPRKEVHAALSQVAQIPTEEEWEQRKVQLKTSALEWATAHGLLPEQPEMVNR